MPLFYSQTINDFTKLALWHITESESFFTKQVTLVNQVTHPQKRLQHLAGRYLLKYLAPDFPLHLISINPSRKPELPGNTWHFSISHCGDYAAVILSKKNTVGIDVELITPKILKISQKFLNEGELNLLTQTDNDKKPEIITLFWSAKEAIFKWYGKGALSFKRNMAILEIIRENEHSWLKAQFIKDSTTDLRIHFRFFDSLCLVWLEK